MTTLDPIQAAALGYSAITGPIDPCDAQYARNAAASLERDHIPHAIVTLPNGCLQVWRRLAAARPTEHRRPKPRRPQDRCTAPQPQPITPEPDAASSVLLPQAMRLAATGNRYAATQLRAFDTIVLTTAVQEWEPLGFRSEFIRLIETELRRRADLARIGQSHLCAA
jgi:hypothetical protein